jgi:hypothetical protein
MNGIVVDDRPTQDTLDAAERDRQIIVSFTLKPDCVVDTATGEAFLEGYLAALGISHSPRHIIVLVPKNVPFDLTCHNYLEELMKAGNDMFRAGLGFFGSNTLPSYETL